MTWYVIRLGAGATRKSKRGTDDEILMGVTVVERALMDAGFEPYLPRLRLERRHHRLKKIIVKSLPMFTGYAFVDVGDGQIRWRDLVDCDGVAGVLGYDGTPMPVATESVEAIRAAEIAMVFDDTREARIARGQEGKNKRETARKRYRQGMVVRPTKGPFEGFNGFVEDVTGQGLIKVAIEIFGRATPVEFDPSQLDLVA